MRRFVVALVLVASLGSAGVALAFGCGIPPIPPIPAIGCRTMVPVCVCNSSGTRCWWQFECVPY